MKKIFVFILTILTMITCILAGCSQQNTNIEMGELEYEVLDSNKLTEKDVQSWHEENYKKEGIHSFDTEDYKYIMVAAGEKPTGGYYVEITSIKGEQERIVVDAKLDVPEKDAIVIEALTYPNALVRINKDGRNVVIGEFDNKEGDNQKGLLNEEGVYVGLIDNNSCEIEVEGKAKAYRLGEQVRQSLEGIESGDEVTFTFYKNEHNQLVLTEIEKVK